jgi:hypothetical protein
MFVLKYYFVFIVQPHYRKIGKCDCESIENDLRFLQSLAEFQRPAEFSLKNTDVD